MVKMIKKKHIYAIDFAIIVGTLIAVFVVVGYARPLVIAPLPDYNTTNSFVLFDFQRANLILIDDNPNFTSPDKIYVSDNLVVNLAPGVYYWKVVGELPSEIRKLTILSTVDLRLRQNGDLIEVVNAGNTELEVSVFRNETLIEKILLDIDEGANVSGNKIQGAESEK